ncbi:MAG: efflux RND transporter periplasmic adaptor subunit [Candidatus Obscuribacterales bacterium]|nr:efflux RND transporter periplasmic adaptor subunit [Candidatus Obscuribacterales bacterium]
MKDLQELPEMAELAYTDESEKLEREKKPSILRFLLLFLLGGVLLAGLWYFTGSTKKAKAPEPRDKTIPVTVAVAQEESVPIEIRSIGNVLAYSVVNVVPQVSGQLKHVYFKQGAFVKQGEPLFQIDPSPYQASLEQAEGNLARDRATVQQAEAALAKDMAHIGEMEAMLGKDRAQAVFAERQDQRYKVLLSQGAVSLEQHDQVDTNLAVAKATIQADIKQVENAKSVLEADKAAIRTARGQTQADEAMVHTAQIQLGWTTIRSPINGKTSSLNVYEGNVVTAQSNQPLVSIAQVKPIYVTFTVPEQYLDQVRQALKNKTLKLEANIEGVKENAVIGDVSFLENTVNTSTGTVTMRATFANEDGRLFPGQFVDVVVSIPAPEASVVVPSTALQTTQQGTAVFVVQEDKTVRLAPVQLQRSSASTAALGKGIKAGEIVVTDGQLQLAPGTKVRVVQGVKDGSGD